MDVNPLSRAHFMDTLRYTGSHVPELVDAVERDLDSFSRVEGDTLGAMAAGVRPTRLRMQQSSRTWAGIGAAGTVGSLVAALALSGRPEGVVALALAGAAGLCFGKSYSLHRQATRLLEADHRLGKWHIALIQAGASLDEGSTPEHLQEDLVLFLTAPEQLTRERQVAREARMTVSRLAEGLRPQGAGIRIGPESVQVGGVRVRTRTPAPTR